MTWANGPLTVYHGCDLDSATDLVKVSPGRPPRAHSIDLKKCKPYTDFARGFYTTTNLHQAKQWANDRATRLRILDPTKVAAVVEFAIDREQIASVSVLCFVTEGSVATSDYWTFVTSCRSGPTNHRFKSATLYDIVFGPVSLWKQTLVIKDCDQISFHTDQGLGTIISAKVLQQGSSTTPLLT